MPCYLYILFSYKIDKYYIGISENSEKRLISHNLYPKGWTKRGIPWKLVYKKEFQNREEALYWEKFIKAQKRRDIIELIIEGKFEFNK